MKPSFVFVGEVFFRVTPSGDHLPVADTEVPEDGWEHHTTCSCYCCGGAQRHDVASQQRTTAENQ